METIPNGEVYLSQKVSSKAKRQGQRLTFPEGRPVEVIEHTDIQASSIMSKNELKVFMVGSLLAISLYSS